VFVAIVFDHLCKSTIFVEIVFHKSKK